MSILALSLKQVTIKSMIKKIKQLIEERNIARKNKDFARSDEIRRQP